MSSFKRNPNLNKKPGQTSIPPVGFHPSHYNGVAITSTGVASLDDLLGGGLPSSSSFLIQEDYDGTYAKLILRYAMAQAIASNQNLIVIGSSFDEGGDPQKIINRLMSLDESYESTHTPEQPHAGPSDDLTAPTGASDINEDEDEDDDNRNTSKMQRMKIAWRYENMNHHHAEAENQYQQSRCHSFNLGKTMKLTSHQLSKIDCIDVKNLTNCSTDLINKIKKIIQDKRNSSSSFRIVIQSIGSIGWPPLQDFMIFRFLKELQVFLRDNLPAKIAIISFPSACRSPQLSKILPWATSASMSLRSFAGDDRSQAAFPNHQGAVHFIKLPSPESLSSPATKLSTIRALGGASEAGIDGNLGFKLGRRKGFRIEMMGLGLDIDNEDDQVPEKHTPSFLLEETSNININDQSLGININNMDSKVENKKSSSSLKPKLKVRFGNNASDPSAKSLKNTDW